MFKRMKRRDFLAAAGAMAAGPAFAIETQPWAGPLDQHGWRPANAPPGAVSWETLSSTRGVERTINGFTWLVPVFTAPVRALDKKVVKVAGFMLPLETAPQTKRFLLTAYPPSCPYCLDVGPGFFIEVLLRQPARFSNDQVLIEGRLDLLERDENGLFYRLSEARFIS
jgi:hypothetical protein